MVKKKKQAQKVQKIDSRKKNSYGIFILIAVVAVLVIILNNFGNNGNIAGEGAAFTFCDENGVDNEKDVFVKGEVQFRRGNSQKTKTAVDKCMDSKTVREVFCQGNAKRQRDYKCAQGCSDGRCVYTNNLPPDYGCEDQDGLNFHEFGFNILKVDSNSQAEEHKDICLDGNTLREWYCNKHRGAAIKKTCVNGCKDGVCLGENTCGNGVVDAGEECDDGESNSNYNSGCTTICTTNKCGDGFLTWDNAGSCDNGSLNGKVCSPITNGYCDWCDDNCRLKREVGGLSLKAAFIDSVYVKYSRDFIDLRTEEAILKANCDGNDIFISGTCNSSMSRKINVGSIIGVPNSDDEDFTCVVDNPSTDSSVYAILSSTIICLKDDPQFQEFKNSIEYHDVTETFDSSYKWNHVKFSSADRIIGVGCSSETSNPEEDVSIGANFSKIQANGLHEAYCGSVQVDTTGDHSIKLSVLTLDRNNPEIDEIYSNLYVAERRKLISSNFDSDPNLNGLCDSTNDLVISGACKVEPHFYSDEVLLEPTIVGRYGISLTTSKEPFRLKCNGWNQGLTNQFGVKGSLLCLRKSD